MLQFPKKGMLMGQSWALWSWVVATLLCLSANSFLKHSQCQSIQEVPAWATLHPQLCVCVGEFLTTTVWEGGAGQGFLCPLDKWGTETRQGLLSVTE